jgi:outer membrane protein assembly factor BamB
MIDGSSAEAPPVEAFGDSVVVALGLEDGLPLWSVPASDELRGVSFPVGVEDRVIVQSAWCNNNVVAALDATTGELLWRTDPALSILEYVAPSPSMVDELGVLVTMVGQPSGQLSVTGIDTSNGQVAWTDGPSPDRGFFIAESASIVAGWSPMLGTMWVLDRRNGSELWSVPVGEPLGANDGGAPIIPQAAADDEHLYVIVGVTITAYAATTGDSLWTVTNPSWAFPPSAVVASSDVVLTGSQEGIVTYDGATGDELWRLDDGMAVGSLHPTSVADGNLYLNTGAGVAGIDVTTGERLWEASPAGASSTVPGTVPFVIGSDVVAAGNDRVLVRTPEGLEMLDAVTGTALWGPTPMNMINTRYTIGPTAVLLGKTCGGD